MTSTHEARVERPLDELWQQLQDTDRLLAAVPGGQLTSDPDGISGSLRLKLDNTQITYRISVGATSPADGEHTAAIAVTGKEARGDGTLAATVDIRLVGSAGGPTTLVATLDRTVTGRGGSVTEESWDRAASALLAGVVESLADDSVPDAGAGAIADAPVPVRSAEPGRSPAKQPAAAAAGLVVLVLFVRFWRRRVRVRRRS